MSSSFSASALWRQAPFVRLLLFWLPGIYLPIAGLWPPSQPPPAWLLPCCLLPLLGVHVGVKKFGWRAGFGIVLMLALAGLGYWRVAMLADGLQPLHFSQQLKADQAACFEGRILQRQLSATGRLRLSVAVRAIGCTGTQTAAAVGNILVWVSGDRPTAALAPGSLIRWPGSFRPIRPPANPHAFDFRAYQANKNCFFESTAAQWQLEQASGGSLAGLAHTSREQLLRILRSHLTSPEELAVGTALVLGSREDMQQEVQQAYAATGAIHVLAVSGLHVGIIAIGLQWLLAWLPLRGPAARWLLLLANLTGVWIFALLTGLSPSVQRAALMFSMMLLGKTLQRPHQIFNTLAASAFLLLWADPWMLLDVGFQLSYLAVAGILLFHPRFHKLLFFRNKWLAEGWNLIAMGVAAQLSTFPLSLYYFHQFPVYFWLSGLLVVPLSPFILGLGIALLALQAVPWVSVLLGWLLWAIIRLMNAGVFLMSELPAALIRDWWISDWSVCLLYGSLAAWALFLENRHSLAMMAGLVLLAGSLLLGVVRQQARHTQRAWVVYQVAGASVMDWYVGKCRFSIEMAADKERAAAAATTNHRSFRAARCCRSPSASWQQQAGWVVWEKGRIALIDSLPPLPPPAPVVADAVLVRANPRLRIADLQAYVRAGVWVFDGSNRPYRVRQWLEECRSLGLRCHATGIDGAWIMEK
jgi:competence protein ComEC